jgi:hypothetical protein
LIKNVSQFDSQKSERQKRRIQRQQKQATTSMYEAHASQLIIPMQHNDENLVNEEDINDCLQNKTDAVNGLLLLSQISKDVGIQVQEEELLNTRSVGIQCNGLDFKKDAELQVCTNEMLTVCDFIKTEKELSTATELKAFVLLHTIVELLSTIIKDHRIHKLSLYKRETGFALLIFVNFIWSFWPNLQKYFLRDFSFLGAYIEMCDSFSFKGRN